MLSGRLDRKIEFPVPNEEARANIMRIHSRKMNTTKDVNFEELARCTDDFNGAQLKAVCVEAGMIALRRGASELNHEDYMEGTFSSKIEYDLFISPMQAFLKFNQRKRLIWSIMHDSTSLLLITFITSPI